VDELVLLLIGTVALTPYNRYQYGAGLDRIRCIMSVR
jgi:hypothetical protein